MDLVRASRRTGGDNDPSANWRQMQGSVEECLRASMRIVDTVARLSASGQMYRSFWVSFDADYTGPNLTDMYIGHYLLCIYCCGYTLSLHHQAARFLNGFLPRILRGCSQLPEEFI